MSGYRLSDDKQVVSAAALAIARVIAKKTVAADARLEKLDGLARIAATEDLARGMVGAVAEEATHAVVAIEGCIRRLASQGATALTAESLASTAQSAFEDACDDDPSPYEIGLAWRAAGKALHELLVEAAEDAEPVG